MTKPIDVYLNLVKNAIIDPESLGDVAFTIYGEFEKAVATKLAINTDFNLAKFRLASFSRELVHHNYENVVATYYGITVDGFFLPAVMTQTGKIHGVMKSSYVNDVALVMPQGSSPLIELSHHLDGELSFIDVDDVIAFDDSYYSTNMHCPVTIASLAAEHHKRNSQLDDWDKPLVSDYLYNFLKNRTAGHLMERDEHPAGKYYHNPIKLSDDVKVTMAENTPSDFIITTVANAAFGPLGFMLDRTQRLKMLNDFVKESDS